MQDVQDFRAHIPQLMAQQVLDGSKQMVGFALPGVLGPLGDAAEALSSMGGGAAASTAAADATTTLDKLGSLATKAAEEVGPGSGHAYGSNVDSAFAGAVRAIGDSNLVPEQSYLNGRIVNYGTTGSIRVDVVEGPILTPTAIYDLKTGSASLTAARIADIRAHLPWGYKDIPIYVVRP